MIDMAAHIPVEMSISPGWVEVSLLSIRPRVWSAISSSRFSGLVRSCAMKLFAVMVSVFGRFEIVEQFARVGAVHARNHPLDQRLVVGIGDVGLVSVLVDEAFIDREHARFGKPVELIGQGAGFAGRERFHFLGERDEVRNGKARRRAGVAAVLIDISQGATMEASFDLGSRMLNSMSRINRLQKAEVQQAGFMVLKSPDIPSVLVETAFISNPHEEKLLSDPDYQDKMAQSIFEGVRSYFARYRPQQVASAGPVKTSGKARSTPVRLKR